MQISNSVVEKLWRSHAAEVEFAGEDSVETRPCFMGALQRFMHGSEIGNKIKRVFAVGMAAIALSGALAMPAEAKFHIDMPQTGIHMLDGPDGEKGLFRDQEHVSKVFSELASNTGMELLTVDVNSPASVDHFRDHLKNLHIHSADHLADQIVDKATSDSPVAANQLHSVGHSVAVFIFDSDNNEVLKSVFGSLEAQFHGEAGTAIGNATLFHETMHTVIHNAEYNGKMALAHAYDGDFSVYDKWSQSVDSHLAHPDVKQIISEEVQVLHKLHDNAHGQHINYDLKGIVQEINEVSKTDAYVFYQEHMADAFMSLKFKQDGHDISNGIAAARAAAVHDPIHNTSATQQIISATLTQDQLTGLNAQELASLAAHVVKNNFHTPDADFKPFNNGIDDQIVNLVDAPRPHEGKLSSSNLDRPSAVNGQAPELVGPVAIDNGGIRVAHGALTVPVLHDRAHEQVSKPKLFSFSGFPMIVSGKVAMNTEAPVEKPRKPGASMDMGM